MRRVRGGLLSSAHHGQVLLGLTLLTLMLAVSALGQTTSEMWETARRQPIVDGQGAVGIRLGDDLQSIVQKLGPPDRSDAENRSSTMGHLWQHVGPNADWHLALNVSYTIGQTGADAIHVTAVRRNRTTPFPYLGRTQKGYAVGEGIERLRALYGTPDHIFALPPAAPRWFWYRAAGLVVSPPVQGDYEATQFAVLRPNTSADEAHRLLIGQ